MRTRICTASSRRRVSWCCATRRIATAPWVTWRGNAERNVLGLMPHPEHAVDPLLCSGDGALLLAALVGAARERTLALA